MWFETWAAVSLGGTLGSIPKIGHQGDNIRKRNAMTFFLVTWHDDGKTILHDWVGISGFEVKVELGLREVCSCRPKLEWNHFHLLFHRVQGQKTNKQINKEWTKILSARAVRWLSYYFGLCDRCCHGLRIVTKYTPRARLACPLSLPRAGVYCLRHYSQSNVSTAFIVARPISFRSNTTFWLVKQSFFGEER